LGAGWSVAGGQAVATATTDGISQIPGLIIGKRYRVSVNASITSGSLRFRLGFSGGVDLLNGLNVFFFEAAANFVAVVGVGTASGTIDNISVKELPGNHRFQSTSANRPVVSARVNLLTKTEQLTDVIWTTTGTKGTLSNGLTPVSFATTSTDRRSVFAHTLIGPVTAAGQQVLLRGRFEVNASMTTIALGWVRSTRFGWAAYDTLTDTWSTYEVSSPGTFEGLSAEEISPNVWEITVRATSSANTPEGILAHAGTGNASDLRLNAPIGSVSVGFIDARFANQGVNLPAYQRVNTSTDYDSTGFPVYIKPNGSNQFMQTNSINFTATDKMTVWQGVRKLSDAALASLTELGTSETLAGSLTIQAPHFAAAPSYLVGLNNSGGRAQYSLTTFAAPITNTLSVAMDMSAATQSEGIVPLVNAATPTIAVIRPLWSGSGTFGNYPVYFYARAGTSLYFSGNDYGSIARGAASTAAQIANGEAYINSKTKAYT
jgi:hypothetical protein